MKRTLSVLATAALLVSGGAFAGSTGAGHIGAHGFVAVQDYDRWDDRSANINERESRIRNRIERGINDGRITRREANRLLRELSAIEAKERAFRADGRIRASESRRLNADLDRLAEHVRHQLRDEQRRY
jgi:hypothetical protein